MISLALAAQAATFSVESLIQSLVWIIIIGIVFWLLWWLIGYVGLPEPFNKVARVILGVVAVLTLIVFLLSLVGVVALR